MEYKKQGATLTKPTHQSITYSLVENDIVNRRSESAVCCVTKAQTNSKVRSSNAAGGVIASEEVELVL